MTSSRDPYPKQLEWRAGRAGLHVRPRYLHVIEDGALALDEAPRLHAWIDAWARATGRRRVLLDLRASRSVADPEIQDARRRSLASDAWLCQVAIVASSEGSIATFDLFAVVDGVRARGFRDLSEAHRWLRAATAADAVDLGRVRIDLRSPGRLRDAR